MTGSNLVTRIDNLLKAQNLKRQALADYCGISVQSFTDWTRRGTLPTIETGFKIAEFLGVSVNWLIDETYEERWKNYDDDATTDDIWMSPRGIIKRIEIIIRQALPHVSEIDPYKLDNRFFQDIIDIISMNEIIACYQNRYEPTLIQLFEIAKKFKVSLGWLISGHDHRENIPTDKYILGLAQDHSNFLKYFHCLPNSDQEQIESLVVHLFHSRRKIRETLVENNIDVSDIPDLIK